MIRRWFRALTRTGFPSRPYSSPPRSGRRLRTLLRLEPVEDRTLASVSPLDPVEPPTAPGEAQISPAGPDAPPDKGAPAAADGTVTLPADGFNFGWDGSAAFTPEAVRSVADAAAVVDTVEKSITLVGQQSSARQPASLGEPDQSAKKSNQPHSSDPTTRTVDSGPSSSTDAGASRTAESHSSAGVPANSPTPVANGRAPTTLAAANPTGGNSSLPVRSSVADGPARQPQVNSDPAIRRAIGVARTAALTARAHNQPAAPELSDGALLHRFVANRDQAAFTALVQRHGRLVLNVCQRVLGDFHAAQDASQATFLVLARKAGILDRTNPIGGWLYKVAYHLALRSRAVAARQRLGEQEGGGERTDLGVASDAADLDQRELHQVIREELEALPEKYRAPLALCYLDGRSHADAAREIGVPRGSMAKRVGEGLERLRERLLHRGLVL